MAVHGGHDIKLITCDLLLYFEDPCLCLTLRCLNFQYNTSERHIVIFKINDLSLSAICVQCSTSHSYLEQNGVTLLDSSRKSSLVHKNRVRYTKNEIWCVCTDESCLIGACENHRQQ